MLTFPGLLSNVIACSFRVLHYVATCTVNRQTIEHMLSRASQALLNTLRWIQAQSCSAQPVAPHSHTAINMAINVRMGVPWSTPIEYVS